MPLSVAIKLMPATEPEGKLWLQISARADMQEGALTLDWDKAFGAEHVLIMSPPSGGIPISKKSIIRRSSKQERQRIEAIGGRRHRGSGSKPGYKSDGSAGYLWRMENKFTTAESYRLTLNDLSKLRSECINGQAPVFNIDFQDKHTGAVKDSWVLVPTKTWERLVNASTDDK